MCLQGKVKKTNWGTAGDAPATAQTPPAPADVKPPADVTAGKQSDVTAVISSPAANGKAGARQQQCRQDVDNSDQILTEGESLTMSGSAVAV